jgi:hypothetical protein
MTGKFIGRVCVNKHGPNRIRRVVAGRLRATVLVCKHRSASTSGAVALGTGWSMLVECRGISALMISIL